MFDCRTGIFRMTGLLCSFADFLPDALELLKSDFPEGYELIRDYFLREDKVTMWYLVEKYGLSIDMVRYRIKIAKQKLKEYIILHENE